MDGTLLVWEVGVGKKINLYDSSLKFCIPLVLYTFGSEAQLVVSFSRHFPIYVLLQGHQLNITWQLGCDQQSYLYHYLLEPSMKAHLSWAGSSPFPGNLESTPRGSSLSLSITWRRHEKTWTEHITLFCLEHEQWRRLVCRRKERGTFTEHQRERVWDPGNVGVLVLALWIWPPSCTCIPGDTHDPDENVPQDEMNGLKLQSNHSNSEKAGLEKVLTKLNICLYI